MKRTLFVCLSLLLPTALLLSQSKPVPLSSSTKADPKAQARILDQYGKLPLSFEANHGQTDSRVKFLSRTSGYTLFLTGDEAVLALSGKNPSTNKAKMVGTVHTPQFSMAAPKSGGVLRMKLRKANPSAKVTGTDELAGTSNYFVGNDPAKWRTNVPTYAKVKYEGIYSGIDLVYYGTQHQLEYDFIVGPGADPHRIAFDVRGATRIRKNGNGELVFKVGEDEIRWHKPVVYQEKNGVRQEIVAHYAITGTSRVGFELAKYDANRPLYIDPLIYSTYLGGSAYDQGNGIAVDSSGNAYVTGYTNSTNFPVSSGAFQTTIDGGQNTFVTKLNPTGSGFVYSTYLGGSYRDFSNGIAVDSSGNAYVTGGTTSTNFPTTPGAFQTVKSCRTTNGCKNAFVTEINPSGSALVYSTYLGGSAYDQGNGIAVDSSGDAYLTGVTTSINFPTTPGAFQTVCGNPSYCFNAFVAEINPTGSALVYSTYLGGSVAGETSIAIGFSIAVDSVGDAYVTGQTGPNFPATPGAFQTTCNGGAFVTKFNAIGSALGYSTFLCDLSGYGIGRGIAVDSLGDAYVTGYTGLGFPVTPGAFQTVYNGPDDSAGDAFVTEINPSGSALVYSTYLGGSGDDGGYGIAIDNTGDAYVTGGTTSTNFPTTPGAFQTVKSCRTCWNAFVTEINPTGSALVYSTYLGGIKGNAGFGIAVDSAGDAYVTGQTKSSDFPVTPGAFQTTYGGGNYDAFVTKIDLVAATATTTTLTSAPNPSTYGQAVTFTAVVTPTPPDGEAVSFMKGKMLLGTGATSGGSANFTTSALPAGTTTVTAVYGGDSTFAASVSKAVKQVVKKAGE